MVHIWDEAIGNEDDYRNSFGPGQTAEAFKLIVMTLRKEYGVFHLSPTYQKDNFRTELASFFLSTEETVKAIDVIELTLKCIDVVCRDWSIKHGEIADETIAEANERLAEHGLGYSYVDGRILRKDSEFTHQEIVKPALTVLSGQIYAGARQEFFGAFENLRVGKNKEALNDCLKSFESTMKAICDKRGWAYPKNATAKTLISCLIENEILPSFWRVSGLLCNCDLVHAS
ncbi:hypothetical protein DSM110093_00997 [Sulfitobacter sp. DSM 110093]|nr:hypothetical protein DSM110093_00997 [Sulfitobacter sp. DSM 110093]